LNPIFACLLTSGVNFLPGKAQLCKQQVFSAYVMQQHAHQLSSQKMLQQPKGDEHILHLSHGDHVAGLMAQ